MESSQLGRWLGGWVAGTAEERRNFLSDFENKKDQVPTEFLPALLFMMSGDHHQNPRRPGEQPFTILKRKHYNNNNSLFG